MDEKIFKTMNSNGILNLTLGIIAIVVGVASGVLLIIGGSKLLSGKNEVTF